MNAKLGRGLGDEIFRKVSGDNDDGSDENVRHIPSYAA